MKILVDPGVESFKCKLNQRNFQQLTKAWTVYTGAPWSDFNEKNVPMRKVKRGTQVKVELFKCLLHFVMPGLPKPAEFLKQLGTIIIAYIVS